MKSIAIIGASYLQLPLILKAKEMGYITHVFAWAANDVGEKEADYFYPISIVEKDQILEKCREIGICGICSIASDLAAITVNYVAQNLGLVSNTLECTLMSTNKHEMRRCFEENGDPSPKSVLVEKTEDIDIRKMRFPLIVKPLDRSGSRGITKIESPAQLEDAIEKAKAEGFEKRALVEEYITGQEYSVECISWQGVHHFLTFTKKYTSGPPHFIESGHLEVVDNDPELVKRIKKVTFHALDSLKIRYGASHTEIKVDGDQIQIVEIGGRMGGDFIGSDLVELSTGFDFVRAVIDISVGECPDFDAKKKKTNAAVCFIMKADDVRNFEIVKECPDFRLIAHEIDTEHFEDDVTDSSNRHGYYIFTCEDPVRIRKFMDSIN